jgi:sec-independent protein translocase protein TatC
MTLVEHLTELRTRIVRSVGAVAAGFAVGWIAYPWILDVLLDPYCSLSQSSREVVGGAQDCLLYVRDPLEHLQIRLQIALYTGLGLAMPVILWQIWQFVTPGLYPHEKRYAAPFVASAVTLFVLGAGLAYWTMPKALGFFQSVGGDDLVALYSPEPYLKLITFMMLAFGVGFEFPILLVFLQMAGIVQPATLARYRRHAIVGIVVAVAVITPSGDPFSLLALSGPMYLFFELSVLWGRQRQRRVAATTTS